MNQADMIVGIPALVNCLVTVPFSLFFHYAYDVGPYIIHRGRQSHPQLPSPSRVEFGAGAGAADGGAQYLQYQGGFLGIRAFAGMLNPSEYFGALAFAFTMFRGRGSGRKGSNAAGGYDDVGSGNGHEMSRRERKRVEKGRGHHGRRYEHRGGV